MPKPCSVYRSRVFYVNTSRFGNRETNLKYSELQYAGFSDFFTASAKIFCILCICSVRVCSVGSTPVPRNHIASIRAGEKINILPANATLRTYLCLTGAAFCWGCNSVFAKMAVGEVSPMLIVSLRWFGAVMLMTVVARNTIPRDWPMLKHNLPALFLMGALGFTVFNALLYAAAHTTDALNLGIIQGSIPVFVLLGAYLVFRATVSRLQIFGVIIAIIGVCMVASTGDLQRLTSLTINRGDYFMITACLLYSAYALGLRYFRDASPLSVFAIFAAAAFIASLPLSYAELVTGNLQLPTPKGWGIIVLITVFPSFLAQIWFIQGVSHIGAGRAGIFVNLVPVFASVLAVSILSEPFRWYHGIALTLVVSGIWLSERNRKGAI